PRRFRDRSHRPVVARVRVQPVAATSGAGGGGDRPAGSHRGQDTRGGTVIRAQAADTTPGFAPAPAAVAEPQSRPLNPTQLGKPAFLLAVPFSLSTQVADNHWMEDLPTERRGPDARKAMRQWLDLYHFVAS